jgi:cytochrome c5
MIMKSKLLLIGFLGVASVLAVAQTAQQGQSATGNAAAPAASAASKIGAVPYAKKAQETEGDRIFKQQCSRCHNAPDGFSPRISGTVVRHMRVRASLSKHDEEELMRFFNP